MQQRHAIQRRIWRRMLNGNLIHVDAKFLSDQHRTSGVDPLSHLYHRHDQTRWPLGVDTDEGVRCECGVAVGQRRSGIPWLPTRIHHGHCLAGG